MKIKLCPLQEKNKKYLIKEIRERNTGVVENWSAPKTAGNADVQQLDCVRVQNEQVLKEIEERR